MDEGALLAIAVGWAAGVTTYVATMVMTGKLTLAREVEVREKLIAKCDSDLTALRNEISALSTESLTTARAIAATNEREADELRQTIAALIARLPPAPREEVRR